MINEKLKEIIDNASAKMDGAMRALEEEFKTVRVGRATPALLDKVTVEAYGSEMPLNQVANVSTPDARTILIAPWDKGQLSAIERSIIAANLGFNPNNDGATIRINIPPLTEERRKELCKQAAHLAEEARIAVRQVRRHANDDIKKLEKDHDMSEDMGKDAHDKVQKITDTHIAKVDTRLKEKEAEIMKV